ncbi:2'-5' RNA ligase family protein [Sphingomonas fennica]|uniref:2'-5' RNA ligase n=1 Tax=Edaphosphingomonas fennica TaxID=114404 RepID=A0A2T4I815_9SPHN|nr:2'-5' RNA ligase family protein [Sphingomonas fennica]PTD27577.1 2'-5' RNA ligase [Sphingomonas fennica]
MSVASPAGSVDPVRHRFFYALLPPVVQAYRIDQEALRRGGDHHRVRMEHLHMTMAILDDHASYPEWLEQPLAAVGEAIRAAPVAIDLDRVVGSNRSVALRPGKRNRALGDLHRQIDAGLRRAGVMPREGYDFSPHLTLFYRIGTPFTEAVEGYRWVARELVLVHSLVGLTRHRILGRWPLRADPGPQLSLF